VYDNALENQRSNLRIYGDIIIRMGVKYCVLDVFA
jgi:hypothetical protein